MTPIYSTLDLDLGGHNFSKAHNDICIGSVLHNFDGHNFSKARMYLLCIEQLLTHGMILMGITFPKPVYIGSVLDSA